MTRPIVFVHTSDLHLLPALVSIYSLRSRGGASGKFGTRLLRQEGTALDERHDGYAYRGKGERVWNHQDHSAFQLLRRSVPEQMKYQGRALVIDPDVFSIQSVTPLLERDMEGKAIYCRYMADGFLGDGRPYYSTGVMLLNCKNLTHWHWEKEVEGVFNGDFDYWDLLQLTDEDPSTIGELEEHWNSLDKLTSQTRLLHYTRVSTQPWMSGLHLPHSVYDPSFKPSKIARIRRLIGGSPQRSYIKHADAAQERLFFELLAECLLAGAIPEWFVRLQISLGRLRVDAFDRLAPFGFHQRMHIPGASPDLIDEFGIDPNNALRCQHDARA